MDERRAAAVLPGLERLGELRERRALGALREAESALAAARSALAAQEALVEGIEAELAVLATPTAPGVRPTLESLRAAADRRRWLHYDLDQERFYIGGFESDVEEALDVAREARRHWLREHERAAVLTRRGADLRRTLARRDATRAEIERSELGRSPLA